MPAVRRNHDTWSPSASSSRSSSWIHLRSILLLVASSSPASCSSSLSPPRSPWFRKRKKHALSLQQWRSFFGENGKLCDGGVGFLKKVRRAGVHPSIRSEVWPFLLGVYDLDSTLAERERSRVRKRREYEKLRRYCVKLGRKYTDGAGAPYRDSSGGKFKADREERVDFSEEMQYSDSEGPISRESHLICESQRVDSADSIEYSDSESPLVGRHLQNCGVSTSYGNRRLDLSENMEYSDSKSIPYHESQRVDSTNGLEYSDSDSRESATPIHKSRHVEKCGASTSYGCHVDLPGNIEYSLSESLPRHKTQQVKKSQRVDFSDKIEYSDSESGHLSNSGAPTPCRVRSENIGYSDSESLPRRESESVDSTPVHKSQRADSIDEGEREGFGTWWRIIRADALRAEGEEAGVSGERARGAAGPSEYGQLSPWRAHHSARLVAVLEAYAAYDQEIGYCQGMADLLSPIVSAVHEDDAAFWCFVGMMGTARENFLVDGSGIGRQLALISGIIKRRDSRLYRHLEKAGAEECLFAYRMVVVMLRRELDRDQAPCLWEAVWADRAGIRAGLLGRARADLLLYVVAAAVLQKRRDIMDKCESVEDVLRECNGLSGRLDVWRLLDDAHEIAVALHGKVEAES